MKIFNRTQVDIIEYLARTIYLCFLGEEKEFAPVYLQRNDDADFLIRQTHQVTSSWQLLR